MKGKFVWVAAAFVIVVTMLLASCQKTATPISQTTSATTTVVPTGKVVVTVSANDFGMRTLGDPDTITNAIAKPIALAVFGTLINMDDNGNFYGDMAESWTIAPDFSYMDVTLRKGIKFQNGDPFTAADVKFSIDRVKRTDLNDEYVTEFNTNIGNVDVIDDYHVRINFLHVYTAIEGRLFTDIYMLDKNYIDKVGDAGFAANPIGAGPFKWVDAQMNNYIDLEAWTGHYRKVPYIKDLRFVIVPDASTRLAMLKTGEADLIVLAPENIPDVLKDPTLKILWAKYCDGGTLVFADNGIPSNPKGTPKPATSPFNDPRVVEAAVMALDRTGIAHNIMNDAIQTWGDYLAPYQLGFDAAKNQALIDSLPYDPTKAKELLTEAGYPNGFDTTFTVQTGYGALPEAMVSQWAAVGIRAKLVVLETATWNDQYTGSTLTGLLFSEGTPYWSGRVHPVETEDSHLIGTWSDTTCPEIQAAVANLKQAIGKDAEAKAAQAVTDAIYATNIKRILWSVNVPFAVGPRVEDYPVVPGQPYPYDFEYLKLKP